MSYDGRYYNIKIDGIKYEILQNEVDADIIRQLAKVDKSFAVDFRRINAKHNSKREYGSLDSYGDKTINLNDAEETHFFTRPYQITEG